MTPTEEHYDVAVVGYGPVGAVAANLCGLQGLRTLVCEPTTSVYHLPRAAHFDAEIMRVFQAIDVVDDVLASCEPVRGMHFVNGTGDKLLRFDVADRPRGQGWAAGYMFYQPDLERALRAGVRRHDHVDVQLGHEVVDLVQHDDAVELDVRNVETGTTTRHRARHVVGADGARSAVRRLLGIDNDDLCFDQPWLVVDTVLRRPVALPDLVHQICDPARPTTFVPVCGDRRRWEFMLLPGETADEMQQPSRVQELLAPWVAPDDVEVVRAVVYSFHAVLAQRWRDGRVFLAGDAAHQMPPFLGQGMCSGIRDVANLVWKLALVQRGLATDALLDTYQEERAPHVRTIVELAVSLGGILQTTDPAVAAARDAHLLGGGGPPGDTEMPELSGGLVSTAGGRAGARFPQPSPAEDRPVFDGRLGSSFALVATDPSALVLDEDASWFASLWGAAVVTDDAPLAAWLDGAVALVRPDRYVFGTGACAAPLVRELRRLLGEG